MIKKVVEELEKWMIKAHFSGLIRRLKHIIELYNSEKSSIIRQSDVRFAFAKILQDIKLEAVGREKICNR